MTHQDIVNKVKDILNEHGEVDALSISDDRVQLENYIAVAIPDAVVMLASKGYRVNAVEFANRNSFNHNIDLPTNFISLISIIAQVYLKFNIQIAFCAKIISLTNPCTPILCISTTTFRVTDYVKISKPLKSHIKRFSCLGSIRAGSLKRYCVCDVISFINRNLSRSLHCTKASPV